jgi:RNA polymerase sigma-70 factor (ECF subfamily)
VFLTALERLGDLPDPTAFGAWTAAIGRNAARMSGRRSLRLVALEADVPAPPAPEPGMDGATVLAAIRSLPEAYRETLVR